MVAGSTAVADFTVAAVIAKTGRKDMIRKMLKTCAVSLVGLAWLWAAGAQAQPSSFLDRLHSDLQLSPAQDDAWQGFQQAYRVDPQDMTRERDAEARMPSLTGPQRMDLAIGMAEQDLAGMRRRGDALKAFYVGLSPQQQTVFDHDTLAPQQQGPGNY
jgi:LTXXQ motif family protein